MILKFENKEEPLNCINDRKILEAAAKLLRNDNVVAFPTETVYGLAANALSENSVLKIFKVKGRPSDNPLIVHISSFKMLCDLFPSTDSKIIPNIPRIYMNALKKFWPGPLTILLPKPSTIPYIVTANHDLPANPIARALIDVCNFPLAAPSANKSGRPSPTKAEHVFSDLGSEIDLILDGGSCETGVESTVLDGTANPPTILRPGGITWEMLKEVEGFENVKIYQKSNTNVHENFELNPTTPGMKYRHYTPDAKVIVFLVNDYTTESNLKLFNLIQEEIKKITENITNDEEKVDFIKNKIGIMARGNRNYQETFNDINIYRLELEQEGSTSDCENYCNQLKTIAKNIFNGLREMESLKMDYILVEGVVEENEGVAIMNRLKKAASKLVQV
ncbi:hypothetical protein HK099_008141 [Clydaea vesicula]|uniref:Threonylcarbamoyl-AMP synthase n=1 Tax=Clydaea vesicula TaxID=447962 RepID=A0AAD5TW69_9FUNG|nr:hypothetical protein HK099_008141 [Clydaea vesicula]